MSTAQAIITIAAVVLGTMVTRFTPFIIFRGRELPRYIKYIGQVLPYSIMGMLIIYASKGYITTAGDRLPFLISLAVTIVLHLWRKNMLLSIACGTILNMVLMQLVF